MTERIFNIFLFVDGDTDLIHEIGAVLHERSGTDDEKIAFLQSHVERDYRIAKRYPVPDSCVIIRDGQTYPGITYATFKCLQEIGRQNEVIEGVFFDMGAPQCPLMVITPIVDGRPRVDGVVDLLPFPAGAQEEGP